MNQAKNMQSSSYKNFAILMALCAISCLTANAPQTVTSAAAETDSTDLLFKSEKQILPMEAFTLTPTEGSIWNLGQYAGVEAILHNTGKKPVLVQVRAENAEASGMRNTVRTFATVAPGKTQTVQLRLTRRPQDPTYAPFKPFFMYKKGINVHDNTIDPSAVARLILSIEPGIGSASDASVIVQKVRAVGSGSPDAPPFLPFVDKYGQYIHSDWPGKIYADTEFAARVKQEDDEMRAYPGPEDWDKWGGWAKGPKLAATGHFYPTKHAGKWWIVDPDGRLFFSYGPTGVGFGERTPITGRENWFASLPPRENDPLSKYWGEGTGATYMYYKDKSYQTYDFSGAAAEMKYGPNWKIATLDRMHTRLRNWGFNTVANWSSWEVASRRKTPYTVAIHYGGPALYRMPDIFNPEFEVALKNRLKAEVGKSADDPWCIGYFVDNELWWGPGNRAANVAHSALKAAPDSLSKQAFIADLKTKYTEIEKLNAVWGTEYTSWNALRDTQTLPADLKKSSEDCGDFGLRFAERYFATVRKAVKEIAPNTMYLGCRFHGHIDTAVIQVAARHCDVISYNVYDAKPGDRLNRFIGVVDKPFLVGEFGVGSDPVETPFRGDSPSEDPNARAGDMLRYVENAFTHPLLVGAHFFQFRDQPLTGRADGEAVLRGFVDTTDTPHFDLVQANRRAAYPLYTKRFGQATATTQEKATR